jgi:hypothetical protein
METLSALTTPDAVSTGFDLGLRISVRSREFYGQPHRY